MLAPIRSRAIARYRADRRHHSVFADEEDSLPNRRGRRGDTHGRGLHVNGGHLNRGHLNRGHLNRGHLNRGHRSGGHLRNRRTGASKPAAPQVLTHLTSYSVNSDALVFTSVISGPTVGDHGAADQVSPGGKVPTKHGGELLLSLARGTFRLDIADIGTKFTKALGPATIPSTCSDYVSVRDNVPIVPGSGTGAYRGIAGTFDVSLTVNELHSTPCTPTSRLFRQLIWFNGAGTITLAR